jgi:hypothetical protein
VLGEDRSVTRATPMNLAQRAKLVPSRIHTVCVKRRELWAAQRAISHPTQARCVHLLHARFAMVSLTFSGTGVSQLFPAIQEPCDGNR